MQSTETLQTGLQNPSGSEIYGQRKTIVEPVFGQIKNSGFRGFSVRGKA